MLIECPRSIAYMEMRLILARLLWHFDVELAPQSEDWGVQKIHITWEKGPLMVRLKRVR
jgi:cytochrome P450